ncbi:MAG: sigma-70 family RNA polymerase sigma factor [Solirubrobacterales bacterium]
MTLRTRSARKISDLDRIELDAVATDLVVQYGSMMLKDAIEFSATRADAEDAYQRSLEILLTKAPTTDPAQLVPWLRVVVRNEALAIRKARRRADVALEPEMLDQMESVELPPEDAYESIDDLKVGADALTRLNNDQVRCLIAQSDGLDYDQIAELTGFSKRKVTRCLERGRQAFAKEIDAIASGSECERMQPLIHKLLAGDSDAARSRSFRVE